MDQEAKAENIGAVNTQTVSTERGIFKEFSNLISKENDTKRSQIL